MIPLDRKISASTIRRFRIDDFKRFPNRIQTKQMLTADDKSKRLKMSKNLLEKLNVWADFFPTVNDRHFHLN